MVSNANDGTAELDGQLPNESRRAFVSQCMSALVGITVVGVAAPLLAGCEASTVRPPTTGGGNFTLDVSSLDADGKALVSAQKGSDGATIIIARQTATTYIALSMKCTHEACPVNPPQGATISCACHGSKFDLAGKVTQGPATLPLKSYATTFDSATKMLTVTTS